MGSAVFVGFRQDPDGLVFFFSNIACAMTSQEEGFDFRI